MADLSLEQPLTTEWVEISAPLALVDGTDYLVDVTGAAPKATVWSADTDDGAIAPTVVGHPWRPFGREVGFESRTFTKRAGVFVWVRISTGSATLHVTPVS